MERKNAKEKTSILIFDIGANNNTETTMDEIEVRRSNKMRNSPVRYLQLWV